APLRRLVDRFGTEVCLAHAAGTPLPGWVRERLPLLPEQMAAADRRASAVERAILDLTEAHLLAGRVGEVFDAVVVDVEDDRATVVLDSPAVRARSAPLDAGPGERVRVRLAEADPAQRRVRFGPS
ncbi:MAG: RNB domain-containing ribonuclease, partial [Actinomycetota bacterium]|nr:RNB domain-containing ribonuclease [Actinomycetota bacterium]